MSFFTVGLIVLGVIVIIGLILVGSIVSKFKNIVDTAAPILNALDKDQIEYQEYEIENTPKSVNAMTSVYLPRIQADFPEFNYFEFKTKAENMLISALDAISDENVEELINGSNDLISQIRAIIDANRDSQQTEIFKDVVIHRTEIKNYVKRGGNCVITLQSSVGYHHFIKSINGDLKSGSESAMKQTRYDTELVYVQDSSKIETGSGAIGMNCPNCGAPIKTLGVKSCPYCGSGVTEVNIKTWAINSLKEV